jgi:hypothetical protein
MRKHHKVYARREWYQPRFQAGGDPHVHAVIDPLPIALRITLDVQIRQNLENLGGRPPW